MKKFKTKNLLIAALALLCTVTLSICSAGLMSFGSKNAEAFMASNMPTSLGSMNLIDYDTRTDGKVFDGQVLAELYNNILGTSSNTGTYKKVKDLVDTNGNQDSLDLDNGNIVVEFGGQKWNAVYLSKATSADSDTNVGDVLLTLWLADVDVASIPNKYGNAMFNQQEVSPFTDGVYINNTINEGIVYGSSYLRAVTLNNGGSYNSHWTTGNAIDTANIGHYTAVSSFNTTNYTPVSTGNKFVPFTTGGLRNFIASPITCNWQANQKNSVSGVASNGFNLNNETWLTVGSMSNSCEHFSGYDAWKDDKIWIPSLTEVGGTGHGTSIWNTTLNQRQSGNGTNAIWDIASNSANYISSNCFLRTNVYDGYQTYWVRGDGNVNDPSNDFGCFSVRPALHLNLTKAEADSYKSEVPVPQNISEDYDGNGKWLDTLATLTNTSGSYKYPWIDTSLHNDPTKVTVSKIEYTSVDALGANIQTTNVTSSGTANIVNAGKYDITLNIPSGQTDYMWRDGSTGDKKFTITVNPKAVPYTLQIMKGGSAVTSLNYGDTYTASLKQTAVTNLPAGLYELWYQGTGTTVYTASKTAPTNAGTYSVSLKAVPDTANAGKNLPSNYKFSGSAVNFTITPKQVTIPTVTGAQEYTGSPITYVLSDFNGGADIRVDSVTGANGNTATGANGAAITDTTDTFEATKVDTYTVTLGLRDTVNYAWSDGTNSDKQITFEVTQKELLSSAPVSSKVNGIGGAEWSYGESGVTVTITDDRISGENINLLFYYDNKSNTLTGVTTGNVTVITMPANIAVGTHTLTVELNGTTGDNANYKLTKNDTLSFEITSGKIDPTTYGWTYTKDGAAGSTIVNGGKIPFALKTGSATDGVKYELSIQIPASDSFVVVDTSKYVNGYQTRSKDAVGKYTTTVALKSTDPTFMFEVNGVKSATIDVTFSWEIEKGTFDLSGVIWEYSTDGNAWKDYDPTNPPQYNDGYDVTVRIKSSSLPLGLSLDSFYSGVSEDSVNSYVANVSASDLVYNTLNFNAPDTSILTLNWEIAKKNLYTGFKNEKESYTNTAGNSGSFIIKKLNLDPAFELYIEYKYYEISTGAPVTLADIKSAADPTQEKQYKVEAYIDPAYAANYCVEMPDGTTPSDTFVTGSKNKLATATLDGNDGATPITVTYDGKGHFDASLVKVTGDDGMNVTDFTVTYYKGFTPTAGNELAAGETPKDAGEYCIVITLGSIAEKKYILGTDTFKLVIEAKGIELPALGGITFNGAEQNFEDFLGGSWNDYKDIIELGGAITERNVGSGEYVTTLKLKDTNYKWIYPAKSKSNAKYSLAAETTVTGDDITATYNWNIAPLILDTNNMWSKGKGGATLNLPQNIRDLITAGTLELGYRYYDADGKFVETPELKGGRSFKVEAVLGGDDSVRNVQFKTGDATIGNTSPALNYTVPQSGAAAAFGSIKDFMTKTWMGLPIWAWFLIGLAVLILLIIIIVVAVKRRKTKEEREEKKAAKQAAKEEAEARKEAERARLESEREAERMRLESQREIEKMRAEAEAAKAKAEAEAEIAKMRAQAQAQMPQQMPQQMPMQQQYAQQPQMQQYAQQQAMPQQMPQQMPQPVPQPQYVQQPVYGPMPQSGGDLAELKAEIRALKAEQNAKEFASMKSEFESMKMRMNIPQAQAQMPIQAPAAQMPAPAQGYAQYPATAQYAPPAQQLDDADMSQLAELIAITWRKAKTLQSAPAADKRTESRQVIQTETAPVTQPAVYPPDAVITTTTTVDTTKNSIKSQSKDESERDRFFDIDGFYDKFEG